MALTTSFSVHQELAADLQRRHMSFLGAAEIWHHSRTKSTSPMIQYYSLKYKHILMVSYLVTSPRFSVPPRS